MKFILNKDGEIIKCRKKESDFDTIALKQYGNTYILGVLNRINKEKFLKTVLKTLKDFKFDLSVSTYDQVAKLNKSLSDLNFKFQPESTVYYFNVNTAKSLNGKIIHIDGFDWVMKAAGMFVYLTPL